jgi:hypothetical protein
MLDHMFQLRDPAHRRGGLRGRQLSLQRTASGWALFDGNRTVFEDHGANSRRRCIAYACGLGVLRLRFDEQGVDGVPVEPGTASNKLVQDEAG